MNCIKFTYFFCFRFMHLFVIKFTYYRCIFIVTSFLRIISIFDWIKHVLRYLRLTILTISYMYKIIYCMLYNPSRKSTYILLTCNTLENTEVSFILSNFSSKIFTILILLSSLKSTLSSSEIINSEILNKLYVYRMYSPIFKNELLNDSALQKIINIYT